VSITQLSAPINNNNTGIDNVVAVVVDDMQIGGEKLILVVRAYGQLTDELHILLTVNIASWQLTTELTQTSLT